MVVLPIKRKAFQVPSGEHTKSHGKWPIEIDGLPNLKMVIFHGKMLVHQRVILKTNPMKIAAEPPWLVSGIPQRPAMFFVGRRRGSKMDMYRYGVDRDSLDC